MTADDLIRHLNLQPHPKEGGYFRETYRSGDAHGDRCCSTAIYYLLTPETFSALHRLSNDEIFHFYLGDPVRMTQLEPGGEVTSIVLGPRILDGQQMQVLAPKGVWQGSRLEPGGKFALLGCTVAPGFEYADYEHGDRATLIDAYPQAADAIRSLTV